MPALLRKKRTAVYAGRHATDERAPTGTRCNACDAKQLGVPERMLIRCSVCQVWHCSGECFSLHRAPAAFYAQQDRAPWWKRVIGRG